MNDPYTVLGLPRNATEEEAKVAFRNLAKTCHPDLHPNDPEAERKFKDINAAYDTICKGPEKIETIQFRTGDFNFNNMFFNNDAFNNVFREMRNRNSDTNLMIRMTLEESFQGKEYTVTVQNGKSTRPVKVAIPPGIMNGMRLHVAGGGAQVNMTQPPGDLYVTMAITQHDRLRRENHNLITMIPVSVFDVLLKKDVEVVNIEGKTLSMTLSGATTMRLAGQGMPDPLNQRYRGDMLVELFVQYPELTERQIELIKQAEKVEEPVV